MNTVNFTNIYTYMAQIINLEGLAVYFFSFISILCDGHIHNMILQYVINSMYIMSDRTLKLHGRNIGSFGPGKKNANNLQSAICSFAKCQSNHPYIKLGE